MAFKMHMVNLAFGSNFKYDVQEWHLQDFDAGSREIATVYHLETMVAQLYS